MFNKIVVGVDISKEFANAAAISATGEVLFETKIFYDATGLNHFLDMLKKTSDDLSLIAVVMESTAHYHRLLEQYLRKNGIDLTVINPLQTSIMKNVGIRKVKNDRFDALGLARLYMLEMLRPSAIESQITGSLKDLSRQRADIVTERKRFNNKLRCLLDQAFPGFFHVFSSLRTRSALEVLKVFPTPYAVLNARKSAIRKAISAGCGRSTSSNFVIKKTDLLVSVAKEANDICVKRDSFARLIPLYADMLANLQRTADEMETALYALAQSDENIWEDVSLLTTIPGIGIYSAIVVLSEIGDFSRFKKAKQLVAYAGLDPAVKQSGKSISIHNRITKRGSSYLRNILDTCTHVAAHSSTNKPSANPVLGEYYLEKRKTKPANVAHCACMHKMLGYIFAVLRDKTPFSIRTPEEHLDVMLLRCTLKQAA